MERQIHITLHFDLATGKANLNEIVYCLDQLKDQLMLCILKEILGGGPQKLDNVLSYESDHN